LTAIYLAGRRDDLTWRNSSPDPRVPALPLRWIKSAAPSPCHGGPKLRKAPAMSFGPERLSLDDRMLMGHFAPAREYHVDAAQRSILE
jgi:hypothetical protein